MIDRGGLQVADDGFGASVLHVNGVDRVPDQPDGLVAALRQEALQQQRDLPVPARDHYPHAATLLTWRPARRTRSRTAADRDGRHDQGAPRGILGPWAGK